MQSSTIPIKLSRFSLDNFAVNLCKILGISGLVLYLAYLLFFSQSSCPSSEFFTPFQHIWPASPPSQQLNSLTHTNHSSPTNLNHLVFGIVGSVNAWRHRKAYTESWWRPNATRGYLFLDTHPTDDLLPGRPLLLLFACPMTYPKLWKSQSMSLQSWFAWCMRVV
ncbi:hypothetical protein CsSME_00014839 [Camellia sinensis var. sinensis]